MSHLLIGVAVFIAMLGVGSILESVFQRIWLRRAERAFKEAQREHRQARQRKQQAFENWEASQIPAHSLFRVLKEMDDVNAATKEDGVQTTAHAGGTSADPSGNKSRRGKLADFAGEMPPDV